MEIKEAIEKKARRARPVTAIESVLRIRLCVDGDTWSAEEEKTIYNEIKEGHSWVASDLVAGWCENNNINWGIITIGSISHHEHGKKETGHYIIEAYVKTA